MLNIFIIILLLVSGCKTHKTDKLNLTPYSFSKLERWRDDDHASALNSFIKSCDRITPYYKNLSINTYFNAGKISDWQKLCVIAKDTNSADAREFFESNFRIFLIKKNNNEIGLFTGYHEPYMYGSLHKTEKYKYPIYATPTNIENIRHYLGRKTINDGFLVGRNLELLYTDSEIELFFLHIQGSGKIVLDDGQVVRIGYKAQNGHKYFAIGKYFIDELKIDKTLVNANFIKTFLASSDQARYIMELNPSYIFFDIKDDIYGSFGASLTAERSLAVDKRYLPLGVPIWLETNYPKIDESEPKSFNKLIIAQDTGGAIKGIIRGDIFFGSGDLAAKYASNMKGQGRYFILLPKTVNK